jgi:hypothetical protein
VPADQLALVRVDDRAVEVPELDASDAGGVELFP